MRARIVNRCRWLGAVLDTGANERQETALHADVSRIAIWRIPTDEESVVASATRDLLDRVVA